MSDKPINNDDIIKQLEQKIEALQQAEAQKKLEASRPAQIEAQPQPQVSPEAQLQGQLEAQQQPLQPAETNIQTELQKLTNDKHFDTQTQTRSRLGLVAPAMNESGANQRIESGPEKVDKEYWAGSNPETGG